jgi:antitoxin PrlF
MMQSDKIDRDSDPILEEFLNFLAQGIKHNPHHVTAISADLVSHVQSLVSEIDLDLNAPLLDEDE